MNPGPVAHLMHVLATERRVRIMLLLLESPEPLAQQVICQMTDLPELAVSFNLKTLASVGLVIRQQNGRMAFWRPNREMVRVMFEVFSQNGKG